MSGRDPLDVLRETLDGIENLVSTPQLTNENLVGLVKGRMDEGYEALAVLERQRERNEWDDLADAVGAAEQRANELADALRSIASLPEQSEDWHEGDVAVQVARAALDRHTQP